MSTLPALALAAAGLGLGHAVLPDHWMPLAVLARARGYAAGRVLRLSLGAGVAHVAVSLALGAVVAFAGLGLRDSVARHADLVVGAVLVVTGIVLLVMEVLGRGHRHDHEGGHAHGHENGHEHGHGHETDHEHGLDADGHRHSHDGHHHHHDRDGHDAPHEHPHAAAAPHGTATALLERPAASASPATTEPVRSRTAFLVAFGAAASPDLTILPVFLAAGALGPAAAVGTLTAFAVATVAAITGLTTAAALGARRLTAPWTDRAANRLAAATLLVIGALVVTGVL